MKYPEVEVAVAAYESPPARGAWIEMYSSRPSNFSVASRPPHGGRGLKWDKDRGGQ